jgi:hypothetical protein
MSTITIHNTETSEIVEREMNKKELEQCAKDAAMEEALEKTKAKAEADKAALLARLGLTEDELKTILG